MRRHNDISAWFETLKLVTKMGQFLLRTMQYYFVLLRTIHFHSMSGGSFSLKYQLVPCYNVSKTSVSFRSQFWRLCDVLSWSVSLRYQLVRRYDASNWLIIFTYQWDVTKTSQIGPPQWCTSYDVVVTSQHVPWSPDLYET